MNKKVLIVEDQFIEANDLQLILAKAGYEVCGIARSVAIAQEMIKKERPGLVLLDIFLKGKQTGIDLAKQLNEENIAFVYLSANSNEDVLNAAKATQPYGFLVKPFREKDLLVMLEIARYRHDHNTASASKTKDLLNEKLSSLSRTAENDDNKLVEICRTLQSYVPFDYISYGFNTLGESSNNAISFLRIGFDEYQKIGLAELSNISRLKVNDIISYVNTSELYELLSDIFLIQSCISWHLPISDGEQFVVSFYSRHGNTYGPGHSELFSRLQTTMTIVIENVFNKKKSKKEKVDYLLPAVHSTKTKEGFEGIVGNSPALLNVFDLVMQVATVDTSVLIMGESGTGKEQIANSIHKFSPRKNNAFIKLNCAALPATLIESELFGHEKGSFTGASDKRTGKFALADGGTIFLDEIGEMSVDLQAKLLRVLQEKEIEPIGAKHPIKVDVRVIAATNKNLEKEVAEGRFRLDLYYRLNVFPIELPALRDRTEDIPMLANHFVAIFNRKSGKNINGLSEKVLSKMMEYHWPGNIRELENLIERSVLLEKGIFIDDIKLPINPNKVEGDNNEVKLKTIHENERDHIVGVLKKCNGRIWGAGGAAELLNVPPSTLKSKMKKLGIEKTVNDPK